MPRDLASEACGMARDAYGVIMFSTNKVEVGGMDLPHYEAELGSAISMLSSARQLLARHLRETMQLTIEGV